MPIGGTIPFRFGYEDAMALETDNWLSDFSIDHQNFYITTVFDPEHEKGVVDQVCLSFVNGTESTAMINSMWNGNKTALNSEAAKTDAREVGRLGFDAVAPEVSYFGHTKTTTEAGPPVTTITEAQEFRIRAAFSDAAVANRGVQVKPAEDKLLLKVCENRLKEVEYRFFG